MARARTAIVFGVGLLVSPPVLAQGLEGSCFRIETRSMRWEARDVETRTIQEPPSELFRTVTRQQVMLEADGQVVALDGPGDEDAANGWRLEGDSLSLFWERAPDRVSGSFGWASDEELWLGTLQEGTVDGEKGHWSGSTRLRPMRCPGHPTGAEGFRSRPFGAVSLEPRNRPLIRRSFGVPRASRSECP